jgi:hypothetical protein
MASHEYLIPKLLDYTNLAGKWVRDNQKSNLRTIGRAKHSLLTGYTRYSKSTFPEKFTLYLSSYTCIL